MWEAFLYGANGALTVILFRDVVKPWFLRYTGRQRKCNTCAFMVTANDPEIALQLMVDHKRLHI